jgi:hypothetical protein
LIPVTKIRTVTEFIGVHTEQICRECNYLELGNCFKAPGLYWVDSEGNFQQPESSGAKPKFLFIPKPVLQTHCIVEDSTAQLALL